MFYFSICLVNADYTRDFSILMRVPAAGKELFLISAASSLFTMLLREKLPILSLKGAFRK